jgi:hypothetical protein
MENNTLDIVKEIIGSYVLKKDLSIIEQAFIDAVSKREEIKVQLDEYDEKIKFYGELDRAGDYLYISYPSWSALPYSLHAILEAKLDTWKWNGMNIQYSKFLEVDEDIMRLMTDNSVAYLCSKAHYKELVVFEGAVALKMTMNQFKKLNDKFQNDYTILKSYSTKTNGLKRNLISIQHIDFDKLKEIEKYKETDATA